MKSRKSESSSNSESKEKREPRDRRETIHERRRRVLGTTSLRYAQTSKQAAPSGSEENKRRCQVLQAQRAHRQRTFDYIDELEAEIFRLRSSIGNNASTASKEVTGLQNQSAQAQNAVQVINNINIHVLVQSFNGQIAPGIFATENAGYLQPPVGEGVPVPDTPWLASICSPESIPPSLESHDPLTRMLFCNFSENIAPTLVAIDGLANGYRSLLLPIAWGDDLVRHALLASSANHLRFKRPKLTSLAINFQSKAIEKLAILSGSPDSNDSTRVTVLATIILLIITDMMNGGSEFHLLFNMAKSWIEAMDQNLGPRVASKSPFDEFLLNQVHILQMYAEPLLKEQKTILAQYDRPTPGFTIGGSSFTTKIRVIFESLESAIKQTCSIYSYHMSNDAPPVNVEQMLDALKNTVERIPPYSPGENALAWVYFIAAAETSVLAKRTFFSKRLMGIYERGTFVDTTTAFVLLHHIWNCQGAGGSWTTALSQTPSVFVLK